MDLVGTFKVYFPVISGVQILIYLVILLGLGGVFLYQVRRGRMQIWQGGYLLLAFTYLYLVLLSTVYSRQPFEGKHYELVPFWSYAYAIRNRSKIMVKEIYLNVFLLMPSAAMVLCTVRNLAHIRWVVLSGLLISAFIETQQFIFECGLFEWDDMIHNTLGVFLCCVIRKKWGNIKKKSVI